MATNVDPNKRSKGLGDSIAKVTKTLKLDKVADAVAALVGAEGCGCEERRQYLNQLFPYGKVRKFKALRGFNVEGYEVNTGDTFEVSKDDALYEHVIPLTQQNFIEEIN